MKFNRPDRMTDRTSFDTTDEATQKAERGVTEARSYDLAIKSQMQNSHCALGSSVPGGSASSPYGISSDICRLA